MICGGKVVEIGDIERMTGEPTPQVIHLRFESRAEIEITIKALQAALKRWDEMRDGQLWGRAVVSLDDSGRLHRLEFHYRPKD